MASPRSARRSTRRLWLTLLTRSCALELLERGEVGGHLLGQLAEVTGLELAHAPLEPVEPRLGLLELDLEERRGARGLLLAAAHVLVHEERGQHVGDLRRRSRVLAAVVHGEGRGHEVVLAFALDGLELQVDVAAHLRDPVGHGHQS